MFRVVVFQMESFTCLSLIYPLFSFLLRLVCLLLSPFFFFAPVYFSLSVWISVSNSLSFFSIFLPLSFSSFIFFLSICLTVFLDGLFMC